MSKNMMMSTNVPKLTEICFRILLCLFGILGNSSLLFFTIPTVNGRIEPYKILLINLALSDLLTNCMVDIPGILVEIYGTWFLGDSYCKIFWFTASLSITNSILTTLALSIFWFQKLVGNRPKKCDLLRSSERRLLSIFVCLSWLISVTFSMPLLFFSSANEMKNEGEEQEQEKSTERISGCHDDFPSRSQKYVYDVLYLVLVNALPVLGMFFINVRIIIFLIRNRKRVSALECPKAKTCVTSLVPGCGEHGTTECQLTGGQVANGLVSCISSIPYGFEFVSVQTIWAISEDPLKDHIKNVDKGNVINQVLSSLERDSIGDEDHKHPPASMIYNPCNYKESAQITELYDLKDTHLVHVSETDIICIDGKTSNPGPATTDLTCYQPNSKDKLPELLKSLDNKGRLAVKTTKRYLCAKTQIRAAVSIMAVVGAFLIFWVIHLTLRIKEDSNSSQHVINTASLIAASYTTIIPYIFIFSMKKCPCC